MKKVFNTEQFIEKAKAIHGDKYDYSKVEYVNTDTKVCIICLEHGEFWQTPHDHLAKKGCKLCGVKKIKMKKVFNTEQFIEKAKAIHGDKYDYSKVEYVNSHTRVLIVCNNCNKDFLQLPYSHLSGYGCKYCANDKLKKSRLSNTEQFIEKAKAIHGDKYDYSKVEYVNSHTRVLIVCNNCGKEFFQTPHNHLTGQNCPFCALNGPSKSELQIISFLEKNKEEFVYQKRFLDCKNKRTLPFDFYLPNRNICIEYQGRQHFDKIEKFGGEVALNNIKVTDEIKRKWCSLDNNPKLIEITYLDDIEKILSEQLLLN